MSKQGYTITFGNSHIDSNLQKGYKYEEIKEISESLKNKGFCCEFVDLNQRPTDVGCCFLIWHNFLTEVFSKEFEKKLLEEQNNIEYDKIVHSSGRVFLNNVRRYQMEFYEGKSVKGSIEQTSKKNWIESPLLKQTKDILPKYFGDLSKDLYGDSNFYFDLYGKSGMGFHQDTGRNLVFLLRLGDFSLGTMWSRIDKSIDEVRTFDLSSGTLLLMSENATGCGFDVKKEDCLLHCAGLKQSFKKYAKIRNNIIKKFK